MARFCAVVRDFKIDLIGAGRVADLDFRGEGRVVLAHDIAAEAAQISVRTVDSQVVPTGVRRSSIPDVP